mgnify:CR=1 FL=1
MSFTAPKFTGVGRQLHTRVLAGDMLTFTTIKLGDGTMTTEPIAALTDLIHGIITLPVHEVRRNADYAEVTGVFQNAGLSSGFYWREIGIFAADPDYPNDRSHDILYCYQNAAELAEYIPSASSAVIEKIIRVACVVGDAENVTVGLASQAYAKAEDLQALEEQHSKDVERINDALDAIDPTKITTKATPADADGVMIADSADGGKAKRLLWSSVKAALGKLFVPLTRTVNGKTLSADVTLTGDTIPVSATDPTPVSEALTASGGGVNPNLLDNWYFERPVNQRGQTEYAGNATYSIDRWWTQYETPLSVVDGGIKIGGKWDVQQYFENTLPNATYTLSLLYRDRTGSDSLRLLAGNRTDGDIAQTESKDASGILSVTFSTATANRFNFGFTGSTDNSAIIIAIKLELGSAQTLAHKEGDKWILNEIPDYGEQLRRCQRCARAYKCLLGQTFLPLGAYRSDRKAVSFTLPTSSFRAVPTVSTLNDIFQLFDGANVYGITSLAVTDYSDGLVTIYAYTSQPFEDGKVLWLFSNKGTLLLSADL